MKTKSLLTLLASIALYLISGNAFAHPSTPDNLGFINGFIHPFTGIDHLLTLLVVGMLVGRNQRHAQNPLKVWPLSMSFMFSMVLGWLLLLTSRRLNIELPQNLEPLVVCAMIVVGGMLACRICPPFMLVASGVVLAGFSYGLIHARDIATQNNAAPFLIGVIFATGLLQGGGFYIASKVRHGVVRMAGISVAAAGMLLSVV